MKRTGVVVVLVVTFAAAAGCGSGEGISVASSSVPPQDIPGAQGDPRGRQELAWGYVGEAMILTPEDDPSKMPVEAVDECLAGAITGSAGSP